MAKIYSLYAFLQRATVARANNHPARGRSIFDAYNNFARENFLVGQKNGTLRLHKFSSYFLFKFFVCLQISYEIC